MCLGAEELLRVLSLSLNSFMRTQLSKSLEANVSGGQVGQSKAPSCLSLTTKNHAGKTKQ